MLKNSRRRYLIFGSFFLAAACVLLIVAVVLSVQSLRFKADAVHATGTVVGYRVIQHHDDTAGHRSSGSDGPTYAPVIRFRTTSGAEITFTSENSTGVIPTNGDTVDVLYLPDHPHQAKVSGSVWNGPIVVGGVFLVFAFLGSLVLYLAVRRPKVGPSTPLGTNPSAMDGTAPAGQRVTARLQRVEQRTDEQISGVYPWRLWASWYDPQTRRSYDFVSTNILHDPQPELNGRNTIDVLIDPAMPDQHYRVDLASVGIMPGS